MNDKVKKIVIAACILFVIIGCWFMFGSRGSGNGVPVVNNGDMTMPEANAVSNEIKKNDVIEQTFVYKPDTISEVAIVFTRKEYLEGASIVVELLDGNITLAKDSYKVEGIDDQHRTYLTPSKKITGVAGKELTLKIYPETKADTGMALMIQENKKTSFKFGKDVVKGTICFSISE